MEKIEKDKLFREALKKSMENTGNELPSNFAYRTMRRIDAERRERERHDRLVTLASLCLFTAFALGVPCYLFGPMLWRSLRESFQLPDLSTTFLPTLLCFLFFAGLNQLLKRYFRAE